MSRARTKVSEWWETSYDRERWLRPYPQRTRPDARMVARINGGKVYHVTRYRLAPLVRLEWRHSLADCFMDATDGNVCRASIRPDGGEWCVRVWSDDHPMYATTLSEAKAACAKRLLELGYRVVDEKGDGKAPRGKAL